LLEGLLLFCIMFAAARRGAIRAGPGLLSGLFLAGYAVARMIGELFRQPDAFLGFLAFGVTMGQVLSVPMLIAGLGLILHARMRPVRLS
jgi:phosphatidylglycerol:prolipoprotein diacylglycerol transferase